MVALVGLHRLYQVIVVHAVWFAFKIPLTGQTFFEVTDVFSFAETAEPSVRKLFAAAIIR